MDRIITPYNADAYEDYLSRFNLTAKYPDLVFNLRNGFPIGDMPPLSRTYTPPNHNSALEHPEVIQDYLSEEVSFGRMSGPFTQAQVQFELGGHFVSCPLGLVEKAGEPGKYRIIRDLSYNNKEDNYSVNSFLDADDFPTEWGTASQVAEIVSFTYLIYRAHIRTLSHLLRRFSHLLRHFSHLLCCFATSAFIAPSAPQFLRFHMHLLRFLLPSELRDFYTSRSTFGHALLHVVFIFLPIFRYLQPPRAPKQLLSISRRLTEQFPYGHHTRNSLLSVLKAFSGLITPFLSVSQQRAACRVTLLTLL